MREETDPYIQQITNHMKAWNDAVKELNTSKEVPKETKAKVKAAIKDYDKSVKQMIKSYKNLIKVLARAEKEVIAFAKELSK